MFDFEKDCFFSKFFYFQLWPLFSRILGTGSTFSLLNQHYLSQRMGNGAWLAHIFYSVALKFIRDLLLWIHLLESGYETFCVIWLDDPYLVLFVLSVSFSFLTV